MVEASLRREKILRLLAGKGKPVTGSRLAELFGVSRQVIVQDIALLRARGLEIVATSQGYLYTLPPRGETLFRRIACCHTGEKTREELLAIVEAGCRVVDVIVEHPLYGELRGLLHLGTREDVEEFINRYKSQDAQLLSALTGGVHLHTLETANPAALKEVEKELRRLGVLLEEGD